MSTVKICKFCNHWEKLEYNRDVSNNVTVGICELEPFDVRDMRSDQIAVPCGHDGGIYYGENFGCI